MPGDLDNLPNFDPSPVAYSDTDFEALFAALTIKNGAVTTNKILDTAVTLAKMANLAADTLIGRQTAGAGVPEAIACTAAGRALLAAANAAAQLGILLAGGNINTDKLLGRSTAGAGAVEEIACTAAGRALLAAANAPAQLALLTSTGTASESNNATAWAVQKTIAVAGNAPQAYLLLDTVNCPELTLGIGTWLMFGTLRATCVFCAANHIEFYNTTDAAAFGKSPGFGTGDNKLTVVGILTVAAGNKNVKFRASYDNSANVNPDNFTIKNGYIMAAKLLG